MCAWILSPPPRVGRVGHEPARTSTHTLYIVADLLFRKVCAGKNWVLKTFGGRGGMMYLYLHTRGVLGACFPRKIWPPWITSGTFSSHTCIDMYMYSIQRKCQIKTLKVCHLVERSPLARSLDIMALKNKRRHCRVKKQGEKQYTCISEEQYSTLTTSQNWNHC